MDESEDEARIISDEVARKILSALKDAYPAGLTPRELIEKTGEPESTVYSCKTRLERENFIKELKREMRKRPGRPSPKNIQQESRSSKYILENANYLNYSKDRYKLAPGHVEYQTEFLNVCDKLFDEENLDELYRIILSLISRIQRRVTEASDDELKKWAPRGGKDYCCPNCGFNHEARDFIRAFLLRVLDKLEMHERFLGFMAENEYVLQDSLQEHITSITSSSKSKLRVDVKQDRGGRGSTNLRILSIEKDTGEHQILFLAINRDGKCLAGTIDKELVTDDMKSDTMLECLTNDIHTDSETGVSYIGLSRDDSFVKVIDDDTSFPKLSDLISRIGDIISVSEENTEREYFVEGLIIQQPKEIQLKHKVPATEILLRDETGSIPLYNMHDTVLNKLSIGDKIRVIGAYLRETSDGKRELWKGTYGSIIKIGTGQLVPNVAQQGNFYLKEINVNKTIGKNNILVTLHKVQFNQEYTSAYLTIENNRDNEISFYRYGNIAIQGKTQFIAHYDHYYQPGEGMNSHIPPGIEETGTITFEPLDPREPAASFRFRIKKGPADYEDFFFSIDTNT